MTTTSNPNSILVLTSRVFWIMLGPLILMALALHIAMNSTGWFAAVDIVFLVVLACVLLARWLEFHRGNQLTATGEAATPADLKRYTLAALAIGLVAWVVANVVGNHVLGG